MAKEDVERKNDDEIFLNDRAYKIVKQQCSKTKIQLET